MKIFLSAIEGARAPKSKGGGYVIETLVEQGVELKWFLMSYYYIRQKEKVAEYVRDHSEEILIDSGAHSFQFGIKVDFEKFTYEYAEFIKRFDRPNVLGYFEMDIENIIGYDNVKKLRSILENASDKIIPVWHPERGIEDYEQMCKQYANKIIAIGGFRKTDIRDDQFIMFMKTAKKYNCKVHCLGMTRKDVLDKVPFDFVDSSSWIQNSIYGRINNKGVVSMQFSKENRDLVYIENYLQWLKMQKHYHRKWLKECKD